MGRSSWSERRKVDWPQVKVVFGLYIGIYIKRYIKIKPFLNGSVSVQMARSLVQLIFRDLIHGILARRVSIYT